MHDGWLSHIASTPAPSSSAAETSSGFASSMALKSANDALEIFAWRSRPPNAEVGFEDFLLFFLLFASAGACALGIALETIHMTL